MAETTIDPAQAETAQAGTGRAPAPEEPGPVTADLGTIVSRAARRFGAKTALVAPGRTLTYSELDDLCDRVAGGLHDIGVRPGDRVSLYSPNRWEWVIAYHAALRAGAVVNPVNVMLTAEEVAFVLNDCGAAAIFTSGDKAEVIAGLTRSVPTLRRVISFDGAADGVAGFGDLLEHPAAAPEVPRPDPAGLSTIGYTSGTTGHTKGAMQSHRAVFLNSAALFAVQTRTDRDVLLSALPLPHVYGNIVMNGTFMAGATLVLMERFDPAQALAAIQRHGATVFDGVPTMYAMMLADPSLPGTDLSSLRICGVGGQTMPAAKMAEWERRTGAPLLELWGMTELGGAGTANPVYMPNVHGSIGFALPGAEARVASLDDAGVTLPDGEPGELMIRGPLVMLGYYGNEPATRAAIEPDGWMHTGDIGHPGRGGPLLRRRPQEGPDHHRRVQRLPGRDRARRGRPPRGGHGRRRLGGRRHARRTGPRLRGAPPRRHRHRGRDHRALPPAPGGVQASALGAVRARPAQDLDRQGDAPGAEDSRRLRP